MAQVSYTLISWESSGKMMKKVIKKVMNDKRVMVYNDMTTTLSSYSMQCFFFFAVPLAPLPPLMKLLMLIVGKKNVLFRPNALYSFCSIRWGHCPCIYTLIHADIYLYIHLHLLTYRHTDRQAFTFTFIHTFTLINLHILNTVTHTRTDRHVYIYFQIHLHLQHYKLTTIPFQPH